VTRSRPSGVGANSTQQLSSRRSIAKLALERVYGNTRLDLEGECGNTLLDYAGYQQPLAVYLGSHFLLCHRLGGVSTNK
jgi:hypothetical protein